MYSYVVKRRSQRRHSRLRRTARFIDVTTYGHREAAAAAIARVRAIHDKVRGTTGEGEALAIGRRRGADGAAIAADGSRHFAGVYIVAFDVEDALGRILRIFEDRPRRGVATEIDRTAVGREDRLAELLLVLRVGPGDERDAAPGAADMVEPDLTGAERALGREMLARGDIPAVRAPGRGIEQFEIFARDRARAGAVGVHHPDIVAAAAVRSEGDQPPVGREARLLVVGEPRGDPGRSAAGDRHRVDVAEQVERHRAPVGAHVDVHPRSLTDPDRDLPRPHRRVLHVPFRLFAIALARLGNGGGGGEQERDDGKAADHSEIPPGLRRSGRRGRCPIRATQVKRAADSMKRRRPPANDQSPNALLSSSSHGSAVPSLGARQSPRGLNAPPALTLGELGMALRLN